MDEFTIRYLRPAEPEGTEPVVAATIAAHGEEYPLTVRRDQRGDPAWVVEFGDLADEGSYPTFTEALDVAHRRALDDAEGLLLATSDGSY